MILEDAPLGRRARAALYLALGALFLIAYAYFTRAFPRLPGEFTYLPALEPAPFAPMRGFTFEQFLAHVLRLALLAPALVLLGLGLAPFLPGARPAPARRRRTLLLLVCGVSLLWSAYELTAVLRGRAIVDDELTVRDQAMRLADGHLAEMRVPPLGWEPFTVVTRIGLTGKYLLGEPLVQVPGVLLGLPGLLHLLLAALTLVAWWRVVASAAGERVAWWATVLLALSPMFVLTNGTGLSHATSLACIAGAGLGLTWAREGRPVLGAALVAAALGFGCTVRPQVAVPVGGVLAIALLIELVRRRRWDALAVAALIGGAFLGAIAWYDRALTGSALTLPWSLYPVREVLGFEPPHSVGNAFENLLVSLVRFNGWWLGWPLGLGVVGVWAFLGAPAKGLRLWLLCGLALAGFNFLYYSPGVSDTGPVYYYEWLLPGSLLAAHAVVAALARAPRVAAGLLAVHLAIGTGSFLVEETTRLGRLHEAIHGRIDAVMARLETPALLIHESLADERSAAGWVLSFPVRYRSERDPIVTYPRHRAEVVRALRGLWAARHCYYYRVNPETHADELYRCEDAGQFLERRAGSEGAGYMPPPTAARLWLFGHPTDPARGRKPQ